MAKRQPSSRYLLAGSRDTANESRYDVGLLSFQCSFFVIPVRDTGIYFVCNSNCVLA
ncbi:hypothetical protein [Wolbachia endosymbiont (group A) of Anomoia purmunda]|uniref:hypothetical protein n=1 Tax=Wolbachia endosymbiont (group A) of Anomoia purmunda TaxID=2953978 RepID=UPI002230E11C|nr:hypothetical protein [Wolbachia endosymbiont (group A) of Anomoia purmunda]